MNGRCRLCLAMMRDGICLYGCKPEFFAPHAKRKSIEVKIELRKKNYTEKGRYLSRTEMRLAKKVG